MRGQIGQCALFQHGQIRVTHLGHQPIQSAHGLVAILAALVKVKADAREGRDGAIEDANDLRKWRVFGVFQKVVSAALALLGAKDAPAFEVEQNGLQKLGAHRVDLDHVADGGRGVRGGRIRIVLLISSGQITSDQGAQSTEGVLRFFRQHDPKLGVVWFNPPFWVGFHSALRSLPLDAFVQSIGDLSFTRG